MDQMKIKCAEGTTKIHWGDAVAATIESDTFGLGTGMDGNVTLGSAPVRPASLMGIAEATVSANNKYNISITASAINGQTWDENTGLGDIAFNEGEKLLPNRGSSKQHSTLFLHI